MHPTIHVLLDHLDGSRFRTERDTFEGMMTGFSRTLPKSIPIGQQPTQRKSVSHWIPPETTCLPAMRHFVKSLLEVVYYTYTFTCGQVKKVSTWRLAVQSSSIRWRTSGTSFKITSSTADLKTCPMIWRWWAYRVRKGLGMIRFSCLLYRRRKKSSKTFYL